MTIIAVNYTTKAPFCKDYDLISLIPNINKQYGIYFDPKRSPIISNLTKFYSFLMFEKWTSDPKTNDIPMCHRDSQHYFFLGGRI